MAKEVVKKDTIYQLRRIYVRENKSNLCPTLTANMGTGGHNVPIIKDDFGIRKFIPVESKRKRVCFEKLSCHSGLDPESRFQHWLVYIGPHIQ